MWAMDCPFFTNGVRMSLIRWMLSGVCDPLDAFRRLIDPFPAGYQELPIAIIRVLRRINLLIHPAVQLFSAAIAYIRRLLQLCALLRFVFLAGVAASVSTAYSAGKVTVLIATDMLDHAPRMDIGIRLAGNGPIAVELFYFCSLPNLL